MGKFIEDLAMMLGGQAAGAGIGALTAKANDRRQIAMQRQLMDMQIQGNKEMTDYGYEKQYDMWQKTGPQGQMEQLKKAGLNPSLIYGMGGAGGQTIGSSSSGVSGGSAPSGGGEIMAGMGMGLQLSMMKAQKDLIEAQAKGVQIDNKNKGQGGIDYQMKELGLARGEVDRANAVLDGIVKEYAGKSAKYEYNLSQDLALLRWGAESDELENRKQAAAVLSELYEDGTIKKMTEQELQKKINEVGLGKLMISKQEMENAILELEKDMQTKLGIDRSAPAWWKLIGRLMTGFIDKK